MAQWTADERDELRQGYHECTVRLVEHLQLAEDKRQDVFFKEHCMWPANPVAEQRLSFGHASTGNDAADEELLEDWVVDMRQIATASSCSAGNETIFPDAYLRTLSPTFLVRHPALAFPSFLRTQIQKGRRPARDPPVRKGGAEHTFYWSRCLYDWYVTDKAAHAEQHASGPAFPIVLDADDIMLRPQFLLAYSEMVGLDPKKLRFEWERPTQEQVSGWSEGEKLMRSTLFASTGIIEGKSAGDLDLEVEARKWRDEFGQSAGKELESMVRNAMPDYLYLWTRRMQPDA